MRIFLGVGWLHSKVSLLVEMKVLPLEWVAKLKWRMVTKLRGGTAQLRIETGRRKGEGREERKCKECSGQEVEDAKHFLLKYARWQDKRELIERV